jgi:hypothetical protein
MAIQLTPEQEQRLQAIVKAGAYTTTEEALNAALAVVETAAEHGFEGTQEELEELLLEGLNSGQCEQVNEDFWQRVTHKTDQILAEYQTRKPRA